MSLKADFEVCEKLGELEELEKKRRQFEEEYKRCMSSYWGKPVDYDIACDTVNKLLDEKDKLKAENKKLKKMLKKCRCALITYAAEDETCGLEEENKLAKNLLPEINEVLNADTTRE